MRRLRRTVGIGGLFLAAGLALAPAASAWYGPFVFVSPADATPGGDVTAHGISFTHSDPVQARLDSLDGRVLTTFTPGSGPHSLEFQGPVSVPTDVAPGNHVLVFTQFDASGNIEQMPIRARVAVNGPAGGAPVIGAPLATDTSPRPPAVVRAVRHPLGIAALMLIGLAAAGVAMFAAALAAGRSSAVPARVRS
jgi:hypothetical protein